MRRYLVVANQTLGGENLARKIKECLAADSCEFHIVVPATPRKEFLTWTEGEATVIARDRLDRALATFDDWGATVSGEVGDKNPVLAIEDALRHGTFDEIILSTLPPGMSRWLRLDLPSRVADRFDVRVSHVISEPEAA